MTIWQWAEISSKFDDENPHCRCENRVIILPCSNKYYNMCKLHVDNVRFVLITELFSKYWTRGGVLIYCKHVATLLYQFTKMFKPAKIYKSALMDENIGIIGSYNPKTDCKTQVGAVMVTHDIIL